MAKFTVNNVVMSGMGVAVPKQKKVNLDNLFFDQEEILKFIDTTGVSEFRVVAADTTTSDLGLEAAKKLLDAMQIDKSEIDILIFVSQTPDYLNVPNTAPILQDKLGLSKSCITFDVPLGCSGFVYGMSTIVSYMQNPAFRKGLLICGDTLSKIINSKDKSSTLLFGDAASSTLFEKTTELNNMHFNMGSDGSGYNAILIKDGGSRSPFNVSSLNEVDYGNGIIRNTCQLGLEGMDVFSFGINQVPKAVKELYEYASIDNDSVDFAIFHQANKMMNEMIRKKLKLATDKVPYSLEKFGNTSCASIPTTLVTELKNLLESGDQRLLLCGFGVGLSWAACYLETKKLFVLDLIEL
jgi:3-oxoacyl-[acyl-carrier-protein] synthase-3